MWCVFRVTRAVNIDKADSKIIHTKERRASTYFFANRKRKQNLNIDAPENRRPDKQARLFQEKAWRQKTKNTLNGKSFAGVTKASWTDMGKYSICLYVPLGSCVLPATNFWRPLRLSVLFPYLYLIHLIAFLHLEETKTSQQWPWLQPLKKADLSLGIQCCAMCGSHLFQFARSQMFWEDTRRTGVVRWCTKSATKNGRIGQKVNKQLYLWTSKRFFFRGTNGWVYL